MDKTPEKIIDEAIKKTGFILENEVTEVLQNRGWTTISNKYYVDESSISEVREIDLLAYKAIKNDTHTHYTVLIISCKKKENNAFTFLVRDKNEKDPNVDWHPIKVWSNLKSINYLLGNGLKDKFIASISASEMYENTLAVEHQLFASQEIDMQKESVQNDKNIFGSITTLMKAQAYEIKSLEGRKKERCIYSIHLITVVDCELFRIKFLKGGARKIEKVPQDNFVYHYIVDSKQTASQIRFIHKDQLPTSIDYYTKLHLETNKQMVSHDAEFYDKIFSSPAKVRVFMPEFKEAIFKSIRYFLPNIHGPNDLAVFFSLPEGENTLQISISVEEKEIEEIKKRSFTVRSIALALNRLYRYSGDFELSYIEEPPF